MITIVGLGPAGIQQMSVGAYDVIMSAPTVFVRTAKHPAVDELAARGARLETLDDFYEQFETFDEVYRQIVEVILEAAESGDVVYAVPGHPLIGEASVELLLGEARRRGVECRLVGSESFVEATLEALGVSLDEGLSILDALSIESPEVLTRGGTLIYQVYDQSIASVVKLCIMERYPDETKIAMITGAGTKEEMVRWIPLYELDRHPCDHLTTIYIPPQDTESK